MSRLIRRLLSGLSPILLLPALLATAAAAKEPAWQTDFQAAQAKAKAQKKILLVAFTGSDWCPWCKKLKAEVFDKPAFASAAQKRFVLVAVDFPHEKKLSDDLKEQNGKLAKKYKIGSYPSILLLKPDGELIAHTGYSAGGAKNYLKDLADLMKTYESLAGLRAQLPTATGLDRAKLLDQLIDAYNKLGNQIGEIAGWRKEIVALDSHNKAGLKRKYEFPMYVDDAQKALGAGKPVVAEAAIDKALALPDLNPGQIQRAAIVKSNCCLARKNYQASLNCLRKALAAAPKGQEADNLKGLIKKSQKLLESQKAKKADDDDGTP
jgi:thioredoxin-related protein